MILENTIALFPRCPPTESHLSSICSRPHRRRLQKTNSFTRLLPARGARHRWERRRDDRRQRSHCRRGGQTLYVPMVAAGDRSRSRSRHARRTPDRLARPLWRRRERHAAIRHEVTLRAGACPGGRNSGRCDNRRAGQFRSRRRDRRAAIRLEVSVRTAGSPSKRRLRHGHRWANTRRRRRNHDPAIRHEVVVAVVRTDVDGR